MVDKPKPRAPGADETYVFHPDLLTSPGFPACMAEARRRQQQGEPGSTIADVVADVLAAGDARTSMDPPRTSSPGMNPERAEIIRKIADEIWPPQ